MKKLIEIDSNDSILEYELIAVGKKDENNMVDAKYRVKHIKTYSRMYDEHGSVIGTNMRWIDREEILKLYNAVKEVEDTELGRVNNNSIDDGLPF